jgi:hypothetical protein
MPSVRALSLCLLGAAAAFTAGCWDWDGYHHRRVYGPHRPGPVVVAPPGPVFVEPGAVYPPPPAGVIIIDREPPPFRHEVRPPCPIPGHVWVPGYWDWRGSRHEWMPGRWTPPPRHGAAWVEPRWHRDQRGWQFTPGRWR